MPGARILTIVVKKFRPVIVELMPMRKIATHQSEVPGGPCTETGGYSVQPASGAPTNSELKRITPAGGKIQKLVRFSHGNATSRAPIISGITKLPKPPVTSGMIVIQIIPDAWSE